MPILAKKRWTRSRLAAEAAVGKNSVNRYLDGTRASITAQNRKAIAEALDLQPDQLPD
jgi:DNA-binding Xre family transcriptional regulator